MQATYEFKKLFDDPQIYKNFSNSSKMFELLRYIKYPNISQLKKEVFKHRNSPEIMIIDKYENKDNKYFILCFDFKIIIIDQQSKDNSDEQFLKSILSKHHTFNKYFLLNDEDANPESGSEKILSLYTLNKFNNFLINQKHIFNSTIQDIWRIITRCLSAFIIKKGQENS